MLARRLTIMVLIVILFAFGFSAVVEQTSQERDAKLGMFASCNSAADTDCVGTPLNRQER